MQFFGFRAGRGVALAFAVPVLVGAGLTIPASSETVRSEKEVRADLERQFQTSVRPFLKSYCTPCHGSKSPEAQLDLAKFNGLDSVVGDLPHWALAVERMYAQEMPPASFGKQPTEKERLAFGAWVASARLWEAQRNAGDPGPVLARRLSNAEYDYTIRDLTGQNLRPTREFPVDPANQEGFDNSGESLTLSPALMKKYVSAAKQIADHAVLTSTGIEFASHPALAETDRDKFCILRIVDFYKKQPTDYADYFYAAWQYKHRAALGKPSATLQDIAKNAQVSPKYLQLVWETLNAPGYAVGPMAVVQERWNKLGPPDNNNAESTRRVCVELRNWVGEMRSKVAWKFDNLPTPGGFSPGSLCFILWKDRQYASHRRLLSPATLQIGGVGKTTVIPERTRNGQTIPATAFSEDFDPDLFVPENEAERKMYVASFERFCSVFPDAFYIAERGLMEFGSPFREKGRLLTAGTHNAVGYFRDDTPLMELILSEDDKRTLNRLWTDFETVAFVPERMHKDCIFYERAESGTIRKDPDFDFAKSEDKSVLSNEKVQLFGKLYAAKASKRNAKQVTLDAINDHFRRIRINLRNTERVRIAHEPVHRQAVLQFAQRAYRRPLTLGEQNELTAFYQTLRKRDGLTHEEAIRDTLIRVLMSPNFLYRLDLEEIAGGNEGPAQPNGFRTVAFKTSRATTTPPPASGAAKTAPLSDYALASRLSYFLWSSMPDKELLTLAARGELHKPDVLRAQTRRMVKDKRIRALALEWGGNWLDFRRFEEHNAVDRERFPAFTNELREAMFEEPLHFLTDTFQNDRSVLDLLFGKYTFVNAPLAKHYGMNDVQTGNGWVRVDNADKWGRGGILPMAVFLTKNSPGLRTSPVKRGYWMVKRVLGEHIPPPPANVPDLPADESKSELSLREALAKHRENAACASCHARFDSYGLVFEGFGPTGEQRTQDLGGRPVDNKAPFPGGVERSGVNGLQTFVSEKRRNDFVRTFNRKLFSYALGRSLQPSDDITLEQMQQSMAPSGYKFGTLIEQIVLSPQFRNRRAPQSQPMQPVRQVVRN